MKRLWEAALALALAGQARAWGAPPSVLGIPLDRAGGLSSPVQILLLMTALTLLPAAIMSVTPFLRLTVVLHFLRQALGTQSTPSNQVLIGLALFLTMFVMQPVASEIYQQAWEPLDAGRITYQQALD